MSGPGSRDVALLVDFVQAARWWRAGRADKAVVRLVPVPLGDAELHLRVRRLVEVGATLAGLLGRGADAGMGPGVQDVKVRAVADQLVHLGSQGDVLAVELNVASHADDLLRDVLTELVTRFAGPRDSDRTPGAQLPRRPTAAGVRSVPPERGHGDG